jgi:agmatine deiminase
MKRLITLLFILSAWGTQAQQDSEVLPRYATPQELDMMRQYDFGASANSRGLTTAPSEDYSSLRTMAEWEEVEALTISWAFFFPILKQITLAAREECEVIILSEDVAETEQYLSSINAGGPAISDFTNITILDAEFNSIWMRDYAANTVYGNEIDDRILVDWIYNRPRPDDDASPAAVAEYMGIPLYCTTEDPNDLVNTGGNFMSDGQGTAFASELILEENEAGNPYDVSTKDEAQIDDIMGDWMGLSRYIKMTNLPNDLIHHIDMHMKLLDEETLLVSEYPQGLSDGPQIEANMQYVLSNFTSVFGTPYRLIRNPVPPDGTQYPLLGQNNASYNTYSNAVFVNKTVILPTYYEEYDTTAIRIWEESLPGYNIVGIDCDDQGSDIISLSGAIHCITHSVGVEDPLLIVHQALPDSDDDQNAYPVVAEIRHRSGISSAALHWRLEGDTDYSVVNMTAADGDNWEAAIPAQAFGSTIEYYIQATAVSGKEQVRPMPAPEGYWSFDVLTQLVGVDQLAFADFQAIFPNPASAITCVPLNFKVNTEGSIRLLDMMGREIQVLHSGEIKSGDQKFFFDAAPLAQGTYVVEVNTTYGRMNQLVAVR